MYYIRIEKNNYDIDIVIDVTDNEEFVTTSGLSWISIDTEKAPEIGNYFYNEKFISLDSEDYKIIENIIFKHEEVLRIAREKEQEKINQELEKLQKETSIDLPPPKLPELEPIDPRDLPKPIAGPIIGVEINLENYDHWKNSNANLNILINALETKNPIVENKIAKFDPPITFPDGAIQPEFAFPEDTIEEYINYLKQTDSYQKELLVRMRTYLGIPEENQTT